MNPLISIICPVYNKEKYIWETIQSVLAQSYKNWELIFVDDASTDSSCEIIKKVSDSRVLLEKNFENKGANYCRNQALSIAKGDYIIFLDADDLLFENCLLRRLEKMGNAHLDFCVFAMATFYNTIGDSNSNWIPRSKEPLIDFLQHKLPWAITQPIWRKEFLLKLNGFDESFKRLQDVDLHTRALMVQSVNYSIEKGTIDCYYRIDEERKNFNAYEFLKRRIESSNTYFIKFFDEAKKRSLEKYLYVTAYKTYLQLLFQYKIKTIDKPQFVELESQIIDNANLNSNYSYKLLFIIGKYFSLLPFRLPGINWMICKMLAI